jgi:hypothetical protein
MGFKLKGKRALGLGPTLTSKGQKSEVPNVL